MSVSNLAHTTGPLGGSIANGAWRRRPGEPRCLINMARFCVLRARPRCGLPPSSRVKPAPAWSCLNAGIHHARNPALWCSADRSSGKACGRRGSGGSKGVGFDKHGGGGRAEGQRESGRAYATAAAKNKALRWLHRQLSARCVFGSHDFALLS
jgi:hypothetical protein